VTSIPLSGRPAAHHERPQHIDLDAAGGALAVSVRLRPSARDAAVQAQLYPQHTYAVKNPGDWQALNPDASGRRFSFDTRIRQLRPESLDGILSESAAHGEPA
jgi:hypothetical protein